MCEMKDVWEKVIACHDGHGRWCASTYKTGIKAFKDSGMRWPKESMVAFRNYIFEDENNEKHLASITLQEFCDSFADLPCVETVTMSFRGHQH